MQDLFVAIETLVAEFIALPPQQLAQEQMGWQTWAQHFDQTLAEFFQQSLNRISRLHDPVLVSKFVHQLQGKFNELVEKIFKYGTRAGGQPVPDSVHDQVCQQLTVAIDGFSERFGRYFNPQMPLPYTHSQIVAGQLGQTVREIEEVYASSRVNKHLLSIALKPLVSRAAHPEGMTYYEMTYLRDFSKDLKQLRTQVEQDSYTIHFMRILSSQLKEIPFNESKTNVLLNVLLLHYNFNSPEYISFCVLSLMDKLDTLSNYEERIKILRLYVRTLQQVIIRQGASLQSGNQPPANQQIRASIEAEITYLESKLHQKPDGRSFEKIDVSLSSYELVVLVELLIKGKTILESNRSKVYRVIADSINTTGTDALSAESLRTKGNNLKSSAVDAVKSKIIKWLEIIRAW